MHDKKSEKSAAVNRLKSRMKQRRERNRPIKSLDLERCSVKTAEDCDVDKCLRPLGKYIYSFYAKYVERERVFYVVTCVPIGLWHKWRLLANAARGGVYTFGICCKIQNLGISYFLNLLFLLF